MATRTGDDFDRPGFEGQRGLEPPSYLPRAAGLYSEVTWDRDWSRASRPVRSRRDDAETPPPSAE
jgi:hypothetical protein